MPAGEGACVQAAAPTCLHVCRTPLAPALRRACRIGQAGVLAQGPGARGSRACAGYPAVPRSLLGHQRGVLRRGPAPGGGGQPGAVFHVLEPAAAHGAAHPDCPRLGAGERVLGGCGVCVCVCARGECRLPAAVGLLCWEVRGPSTTGCCSHRLCMGCPGHAGDPSRRLPAAWQLHPALLLSRWACVRPVERPSLWLHAGQGCCCSVAQGGSSPALACRVLRRGAAWHRVPACGTLTLLLLCQVHMAPAERAGRQKAPQAAQAQAPRCSGQPGSPARACPLANSMRSTHGESSSCPKRKAWRPWPPPLPGQGLVVQGRGSLL